jgi:NAD(P)-dependent dehydrogenase (short-subunit alcohol dehydrogenase family)
MSPIRLIFRCLVGALALELTACAGMMHAGDARLDGKTYVVTGASSGFGRGTALKAASLGANVVLAARRVEALEEVAAQAREAGGTALVVATDVSDPAQVQRLADAAVARFGQIDVWINNAGVVAIGPFWDIPLRDHVRQIDVNLNGTIYGSHVALRQFRAQRRGTLVNVASIDGEVPLAYQASYSASKAGVVGLGRALTQELRRDGGETIKVSTILPWAADTPLWDHAANYSGGTPRMPAMDSADKVVDAILAASLHPEPEIPVGWKAGASYVSHHFAPGLTERTSAAIAHHWQIETAPPAPRTAGNLYAPVEAGTTVEGHARQRMKAEDTARTREESASRGR